MLRCCVLIILILNPVALLAITIEITDNPKAYNITEGNGWRYITVYPVRIMDTIYDSLPHSFNEEELIEPGHNDRQIQFSVPSFRQSSRTSLRPSPELQDNIFQLLTARPETVIQELTDPSETVIQENSSPSTESKITCFQLFYYLQTGQRDLRELEFDVESENSQPEHIDLGSWVLLIDGKKPVHVMLHLANGIYMSKFGQSNIVFHNLDTALGLYGRTLKIRKINKLHWFYKGMDRFNNPPPPPPGAGACGACSFGEPRQQSAF
ncbi:hypothetical protein V5J35_000135 [Endozoicomonas sp. NE40]|uniref:Uncharacterized protein n=1 Tax=Endozoicomonas lisbonensis TaxID=3120522 RepID=A0ABV2SB06_9GAMM